MFANPKEGESKDNIAHTLWIYIYLSHFLLSKAATKIFYLISSCYRFVHVFGPYNKSNDKEINKKQV
jgi:hypothetical protein